MRFSSCRHWSSACRAATCRCSWAMSCASGDGRAGSCAAAPRPRDAVRAPRTGCGGWAPCAFATVGGWWLPHRAAYPSSLSLSRAARRGWGGEPGGAQDAFKARDRAIGRAAPGSAVEGGAATGGASAGGRGGGGGVATLPAPLVPSHGGSPPVPVVPPSAEVPAGSHGGVGGAAFPT